MVSLITDKLGRQTLQDAAADHRHHGHEDEDEASLLPDQQVFMTRCPVKLSCPA